MSDNDSWRTRAGQSLISPPPVSQLQEFAHPPPLALARSSRLSRPKAPSHETSHGGRADGRRSFFRLYLVSNPPFGKSLSVGDDETDEAEHVSAVGWHGLYLARNPRRVSRDVQVARSRERCLLDTSIEVSGELVSLLLPGCMLLVQVRGIHRAVEEKDDEHIEVCVKISMTRHYNKFNLVQNSCMAKCDATRYEIVSREH